jgi:hypothetical protein
MKEILVMTKFLSLILILGSFSLSSLNVSAAEHSGHSDHQDKRGSSQIYRNLLPQPKTNKALATPPEKVQILAPLALTQVQGNSAHLQWSATPHATVYHVQVAKDPAFKWILQEDHAVKGTTFLATSLPQGSIFWRVAAGRSGNMPAHWKSLFTNSSFEIIP